MILYFIYTILIFVLSYFIYFFIKFNYYRKIQLSFEFKGPPALPVIGNGLLFLNKSAIDNFKTLTKLLTEYGDLFRLWIGIDLNIFLSNPNDLEVLLSSSKYIDKSSEYKYLKPWLNEGLLISEGNKWFRRRKILTPAFHFKILEQFIEIFDRNSTVLMEHISMEIINNKTNIVELNPLVTLYALDVICESSMGTSVNAQKYSNSDYVRSVKKMTHVLHMRMFDLFLRHDFFYQLSQIAKEEKQALDILHGFTDRVIMERREELLKENNNEEINTDEIEIGLNRKMAFLDILLRSTIDGKPLTNLEIREEVDTFMFEGHDTTTSGITFCLYNIAKHQQVQTKCFDEIRQIVGDNKNKSITLAQLQDLHYLELVIKETLRLFPSVPIMGRQIHEEIIINGNKYPAGANMIVPVFWMGRSEKIFDKPNEFRPERYEVERSRDTVNPYGYIPFSAGPRNCIGQKFAMLEMKSVVMKVLRFYHLTLDADSLKEPDLTAEIILVPHSKINFHLTPRVYA